MMASFETELAARLAALHEQGLHRILRPVESPQGPVLRVAGRDLVNFSSNDYLGLANHPAVVQAAQRGLAAFGAGAGASRLVCGSLRCHHELEETLADFKSAEAAVTFSSGYATALGTISALLDRAAVVVLDKRVHACLVDAARLSGARLRVFAHNDLNDLEAILQWADARPATPAAAGPSVARRRAVLVITESVFSMDGDVAPLRELVDLKDRYGAWLMVDEAHATGLYGAGGRGLLEECGLASRVEVQMGTLGKALGSAGGYIVGTRTLVDYLVNKARSFIYSTAPIPAAATAATEAIRLLQTPEGAARRERLWTNVEALEATLARQAAFQGGAPGRRAAIVPWILGDEERALQVAARLSERGVFAPAIRYPTVARRTARIRFTVTAAHETAHFHRLAEALHNISL